MSKPCATCKDCVSKIVIYQRRKNWYECLDWEGCVKLARYEQRLEKKRRYYKGSRAITDPAEIMEDKWIWAFGHVFNTKALGNMQFKTLMTFIETKLIYEAVDKNAIIKGNDNADDIK